MVTYQIFLRCYVCFTCSLGIDYSVQCSLFWALAIVFFYVPPYSIAKGKKQSSRNLVCCFRSSPVQDFAPKFWGLIFLEVLLGLYCRIKANCPLVRTGSVGGVPSVEGGGDLSKGSQSIFTRGFIGHFSKFTWVFLMKIFKTSQISFLFSFRSLDISNIFAALSWSYRLCSQMTFG